MKKNNIEENILKTLSYSDIFNYPLSEDEIWRFYIGKNKCSKDKLLTSLKRLCDNQIIGKKKNKYFILGRENLVEERCKRGTYSKGKFSIAIKIASFLSIIPSILLVGLSGSLSMRNAKKTDDIDFFIITTKNSLWITRIIVFFMLSIFRVNRQRNDNLAMDKICMNMYMSENDLVIDRKNLFTSHEITQLEVIVNKKNIYEKFLSKNKWIVNYLPNQTIPKISFKDVNTNNLWSLFKIMNSVFYKIQYFYMKSGMTQEIVSPSLAKFHPKDKTEAVLSLFKLRSEAVIGFYRGKMRLNKNTSVPINTPGY